MDIKDLTLQDFTTAEIAHIREVCRLHTQGEEEWHMFKLEIGVDVDVDCFDAVLVDDEPNGYYMTAYLIVNDQTLTTRCGIDLGLIPYDEMHNFKSDTISIKDY